MNSDLDNRWSDAARQAALAVRKARAFGANPQIANPVPKQGGLAPKPTVYAGASPTFDEKTGKRNNTEINVWIPPPNDPVWNDPKFVESFKKGIAERKKKELTTATFPTQPNIFYSSTGPQRPLDKQAPQGILRYDPKKPLDASKLGYNMGTNKKSMPSMPPKTQGPKKTVKADGMRYIIGGKRYTRIGNKLVPDDKPAPGEKTKNFYMK